MGDGLMRAIGNTKLDENDNIGALLGHLPDKAEKTAANKTELTAAENIPEKTQAIEENVNDDKLKHNRSAKFTDLEVEQLEKIMIAIGTDKVSKALRWCLNKAWEAYGDEIEKIAKQKKEIGSL
jgi:hypothetical protein